MSTNRVLLPMPIVERVVTVGCFQITTHPAPSGYVYEVDGPDATHHGEAATEAEALSDGLAVVVGVLAEWLAAARRAQFEVQP